MTQTPGDFEIPPKPPLAPTTTVQQDLMHEGQRKINVLWEMTQSVIAITVTLCTMISGAVITVQGKDTQVPTILSMAFGTVVGFYFARTNHTAVGGIGRHPTQAYEESRR